MNKFPECQTLHTTCDCSDMMHTMRMQYWDNDTKYGSFDEVCVSVMMPQERAWYKRIIPAIRYILNLRGARDWHYTDIVVDHHGVAEIQKFLDQYQTDRHNAYEYGADYTPLRQF